MKNEHVYYCPKRPPELMTLPKTGLLYVERLYEPKYMPDIECEVWGWAVYKRELTPKELMDYELIIKPKGEPS